MAKALGRSFMARGPRHKHSLALSSRKGSTFIGSSWSTSITKRYQRQYVICAPGVRASDILCSLLWYGNADMHFLASLSVLWTLFSIVDHPVTLPKHYPAVTTSL